MSHQLILQGRLDALNADFRVQLIIAGILFLLIGVWINRADISHNIGGQAAVCVFPLRVGFHRNAGHFLAVFRDNRHHFVGNSLGEGILIFVIVAGFRHIVAHRQNRALIAVAVALAVVPLVAGHQVNTFLGGGVLLQTVVAFQQADRRIHRTIPVVLLEGEIAVFIHHNREVVDPLLIPGLKQGHQLENCGVQGTLGDIQVIEHHLVAGFIHRQADAVGIQDFPPGGVLFYCINIGAVRLGAVLGAVDQLPVDQLRAEHYKNSQNSQHQG